jgi:hypothetical protein
MYALRSQGGAVWSCCRYNEAGRSTFGFSLGCVSTVVKHRRGIGVIGSGIISGEHIKRLLISVCGLFLISVSLALPASALAQGSVSRVSCQNPASEELTAETLQARLALYESELVERSNQLRVIERNNDLDPQLRSTVRSELAGLNQSLQQIREAKRLAAKSAASDRVQAERDAAFSRVAMDTAAASVSSAAMVSAEAGSAAQPPDNTATNRARRPATPTAVNSESSNTRRSPVTVTAPRRRSTEEN